MRFEGVTNRIKYKGMRIRNPQTKQKKYKKQRDCQISEIEKNKG